MAEKEKRTILDMRVAGKQYKGDALLQKTFCEDFLTKKMKTNQGEVPQYYVENNHEAKASSRSSVYRR